MRRVVLTVIAAVRLLLVLPVAGPALLFTWAAAELARWRFARIDQAQAVLRQLGMRAPVMRVELARGGRSSAVAFVTLADGRRLVLKKALPHGSLVGLAARIAGPMPYLGVAPAQRVRREADALERLAHQGVAVPRLIAADPDAGLVLMECVDGVCLAGRTREHAIATRYGQVLAAVHEAGVALCDGHPGNAILGATGRVIVIDLEWAALDGDAATRRGFDLAYAAAFLPGDAARAAFFRGYGRVSPAVQAQLDTARGELEPFAPLMRTDRLEAAP